MASSGPVSNSEAFVAERDLSDVARYSYAGLCAHSLGKLYNGAEADKEVVEKWINNIVKRNGQTEVSTRDTMMCMATGEVQLENADPFVDSLKKDPYVTEHGSKVIIQDIMAIALQEGSYDARLRTLVKYVSLLLRVDWDEVEKHEDAIIDSLQEEEHTPTEEELNEKASQSKKRKIKRYALISVAALGGGALLGLTGGLAAPLIAAGAGAVIGTAGAAALGSVAGAAIIGSLFGAAGAGLAGFKMNKRVGGIEEFEFEPLSEGRQLHVTIAVSGWLTEKNPDFKFAWLGLANSKEQYVLKFESKYLIQMGKAMDYLVGMAVNAATQEALKYTILSGLLTAIAWPAALLAAASVIDNPWSVCTTRTANVGRLLADVLLSRQQGKRPVTLIGFSLGARVIFYCLKEMAKRKNCEGIVEDVILLGAPVTGNPADWEPLARVVAGKVVNGYCKGDWLLKFLYRTASVQFSVAGLRAVDWQDRRMHNIDLSDVVLGHTDYMHKIDDILQVVGIKTRQHAMGLPVDSLKAWVKIQKSTSHSEKLRNSVDQNLHGLDRNANASGSATAQASDSGLDSCMHPETGTETSEVSSANLMPEVDDSAEKSPENESDKVMDPDGISQNILQANIDKSANSDVPTSLNNESSKNSSPSDAWNIKTSQMEQDLSQNLQACNIKSDLSASIDSSDNVARNKNAEITESDFSNVSSQVTTPDSGVVLDDFPADH